MGVPAVRQDDDRVARLEVGGGQRLGRQLDRVVFTRVLPALQ